MIMENVLKKFPRVPVGHSDSDKIAIPHDIEMILGSLRGPEHLKGFF